MDVGVELLVDLQAAFLRICQIHLSAYVFSEAMLTLTPSIVTMNYYIIFFLRTLNQKAIQHRLDLMNDYDDDEFLRDLD